MFKKKWKKLHSILPLSKCSVLIPTLIYFIIARADTSLVYLCVNSVLKNKGIHLW